MHTVVLVIGIGWAVFWIGWLAAAFTAKSSRGTWSRFSALRMGLIALVLFFLRLNWGGSGHRIVTGPVLAGVG